MSNPAGRGIHVLGIESSCDDTGVAIVNQDGKILSNCIHSQLKRHLALGGIIPVIAKEYHLDNIDRVARQAFEQSGLESVAADVDAIAVSTRPGLKFSLQVGLNYARTLAKKYSKPLIPVHHMQAHALMPTLLQSSSAPKIRFPFIAMLLSGGHCIVAIAKRFNEFQILGSTQDDAPGDLFDKFARRFRLRNLGPPFDSLSGGAAVELLSKRDGANRFKYFNTESSIPMLSYGNCDFSFSGYRGTYEQMVPRFDELWRSNAREELMVELSDACASLQRAVLIQIVRKLQRAILYYRMHWRYQNETAFAQDDDDAQHLGYRLHKIDDVMDEGKPLDLLVSGGVAANGYLIDGIRLACSEIFDQSVQVHAPAKNLCSDNGAMVAWNGMLHYKDFLNRQQQSPIEKYNCDSVVCDTARAMDSVHVEAQCPIGSDISNQLKLTSFKLAKLVHGEFRLQNKC